MMDNRAETTAAAKVPDLRRILKTEFELDVDESNGFLVDFATSVTRLRQSLLEHVDPADFAEAARVSDRFATVAKNLSLDDMLQIARRLEDACNARDAEALKRAAGELEALLQDVEGLAARHAGNAVTEP